MESRKLVANKRGVRRKLCKSKEVINEKIFRTIFRKAIHTTLAHLRLDTFSTFEAGLSNIRDL